MTSRRLLAADQRILLDAANYIERFGWFQGGGGTSGGPRCMMASVMMQVDSHESAQLAVNRLAALLGTKGLAAWNDAPGRTKAEVVHALRQAAIA